MPASDARPLLEDLLNELVQAAGYASVMHHQYQGKGMPAREYEKFVRLRDTRIPGLKKQILGMFPPPTAASSQPTESPSAEPKPTARVKLEWHEPATLANAD